MEFIPLIWDGYKRVKVNRHKRRSQAKVKSSGTRIAKTTSRIEGTTPSPQYPYLTPI